MWMCVCSTKLDAQKRLDLQQEKESLEAKLLEVYVLYCSTALKWRFVTIIFGYLDRR